MSTQNYTDRQTEDLLNAYNQSPTKETVEEFAEELGKSTRSIIAKLVREGVYQTPKRVTKAGEPIVRKADIVAEMQAAIGKEFPTLVKVSKQDLVQLAAFIKGC